MSKPNDYDTYIIPPNFIEGGTFFGGLLKLRNTAEALVIVLATALRLQDRYGILICFDHQAEVLRRYCGDRAVVQAIDFDAFERRFLP